MISAQNGGAVRLISLDRSRRLNAPDILIQQGLPATTCAAWQDGERRAVRLTEAGRALYPAHGYCNGADAEPGDPRGEQGAKYGPDPADPFRRSRRMCPRLQQKRTPRFGPHAL